MRDNNFKIVFEKNTNYRYFRFIEKTESLEEFKLDFTLKQGESVTRVFKGYFEVEYYTYFYEVRDKTFVKYFKDGKQISEFEKYTKLFCIDTLGNHIVKDFGSYDEIGEKYFWKRFFQQLLFLLLHEFETVCPIQILVIVDIS